MRPAGTKFFLRGVVRGDCGHVHRTATQAGVCYRREWMDCAMLGGYTDRVLCFTEDVTRAESLSYRVEFEFAVIGEKER